MQIVQIIQHIYAIMLLILSSPANVNLVDEYAGSIQETDDLFYAIRTSQRLPNDRQSIPATNDVFPMTAFTQAEQEQFRRLSDTRKRLSDKLVDTFKNDGNLVSLTAQLLTYLEPPPPHGRIIQAGMHSNSMRHKGPRYTSEVYRLPSIDGSRTRWKVPNLVPSHLIFSSPVTLCPTIKNRIDSESSKLDARGIRLIANAFNVGCGGFKPYHYEKPLVDQVQKYAINLNPDSAALELFFINLVHEHFAKAERTPAMHLRHLLYGVYSCILSHMLRPYGILAIGKEVRMYETDALGVSIRKTLYCLEQFIVVDDIDDHKKEIYQ
jgi:hypothetical protein